jgi:hypothetical protein
MRDEIPRAFEQWTDPTYATQACKTPQVLQTLLSIEWCLYPQS